MKHETHLSTIYGVWCGSFDWQTPFRGVGKGVNSCILCVTPKRSRADLQWQHGRFFSSYSVCLYIYDILETIRKEKYIPELEILSNYNHVSISIEIKVKVIHFIDLKEN